MTALLEIVATLTAAFFAGGALYISLVEHPARLGAGLAVAVAEFRTSYPRGAVWQGGLAALSGLTGFLAAAITGDLGWAAGALAVACAIPWTLLAMMPTNRRIMSGDAGEDAAARLLVRWGRMHALRSVLGVVALLVFLAQLRR